MSAGGRRPDIRSRGFAFHPCLLGNSRAMHAPGLMLLYVLIGPILWAVFGIAMILSRARMGRLKRPPQPLAVSPPPTVTVLIPAKDEGENVRASVQRVLALDYPNLSVVAID